MQLHHKQRIAFFVVFLLSALGCDIGKDSGTNVAPPNRGLDVNSLETRPTAEQLLADVRQRYRNLATYSDVGSYDEKYFYTGEENSATFRTVFDRDSGTFGIEWSSNANPGSVNELLRTFRRFVVSRLAAGTVEITDSHDNEKLTRQELMSALHVANGVTNGTGLMVPVLLMPSELNSSSFWPYVKQVTLLEQPEFDGYVIGSGFIEIWVSKSHQIRKIVRDEGEKYRLLQTWTFKEQDLPSDAAVQQVREMRDRNITTNK